MMGMLIYLATQIPLILVLGDLYGIYGIAASLVIAETIQALFLFIINRINDNQKR